MDVRRACPTVLASARSGRTNKFAGPLLPHLSGLNAAKPATAEARAVVVVVAVLVVVVPMVQQYQSATGKGSNSVSGTTSAIPTHLACYLVLIQHSEPTCPHALSCTKIQRDPYDITSHYHYHVRHSAVHVILHRNLEACLHVVRVDVEGGRAEEQLGGYALPGSAESTAMPVMPVTACQPGTMMPQLHPREVAASVHALAEHSSPECDPAFA